MKFYRSISNDLALNPQAFVVHVCLPPPRSCSFLSTWVQSFTAYLCTCIAATTVAVTKNGTATHNCIGTFTVLSYILWGTLPFIWGICTRVCITQPTLASCWRRCRLHAPQWPSSKASFKLELSFTHLNLCLSVIKYSYIFTTFDLIIT